MPRVAGKLFVIEGTDGSGKSTQFRLLCSALKERGIAHREVVFPRYGEESSALLRMYLEGRFGSRPDDVGPYAASTFFAVDRYASYKTDWMDDYRAGVPILCDRYTTSNAIHQAAKLAGQEREEYLRWIFDFEYRLLGLPEPTEVFFLDMPAEIAFELLRRRQGEAGDIHERDHQYLIRCRQNALDICCGSGWTAVPCAQNGRPLEPAAISRVIVEKVMQSLAQITEK